MCNEQFLKQNDALLEKHANHDGSKDILFTVITIETV